MTLYNEADLSTFTLLLVKKKGFMGKLVNLLTLSKWNHIAVLNEESRIVYDFDLRGLMIFDLASYQANMETKETYIRVQVQAGSESEKEILTRLNDLKEFKYSVKSNLNVVLDFFNIRKLKFDGWNCVKATLWGLFGDSIFYHNMKSKAPRYFKRFVV